MPEPQPDFQTAVEQELFRLTESERQKRGLSPLVLDARLSEIARAHSYDMLGNNYFSHTDKSGCDMACRLRSAGYRYRAVGENIYTMSGYNLAPAETAAMVFTAWMNSSGHRANMLNPLFTVGAVGVASAGSKVYVTALYSLPF